MARTSKAKTQPQPPSKYDIISEHAQMVVRLEHIVDEYREALNDASTLVRWDGVPENITNNALVFLDIARRNALVDLQNISRVHLQAKDQLTGDV